MTIIQSVRSVHMSKCKVNKANEGSFNKTYHLCPAGKGSPEIRKALGDVTISSCR